MEEERAASARKVALVLGGSSGIATEVPEKRVI